MTRIFFERELQRLQEQVLIYGNTVENALRDSVTILLSRDRQGAHRLYDADQSINAMRFSIESDTLGLIATQQPMATDLRRLAAILEIITELERIGDYAKGIAKITLLLGEHPLVDAPANILPMVTQARDMMLRVLQCYIRDDAEGARAIAREDDAVDRLFNQVQQELMTKIIADPTVIEHANYYLWVVHNLERAADRVTNICERIIFTVTGEMRELETSDTEEGLSGI
ncbi:MAG: phosphate signaling complex protein PhoU [Chloroflexi bacterium]|nr:phosphate signaling complex protein PhoU [Chloroflexota bacterium]